MLVPILCAVRVFPHRPSVSGHGNVYVRSCKTLCQETVGVRAKVHRLKDKVGEWGALGRSGALNRAQCAKSGYGKGIGRHGRAVWFVDSPAGIHS